MVGLFVGTGVAGKLSDTIGRRKTLFLLLCIGAICQLLCGFAYSYETYLVARFFSAFGEVNQTQPYLGVTDMKVILSFEIDCRSIIHAASLHTDSGSGWF